MKAASARRPFSPVKGFFYLLIGRLLMAAGVVLWVAGAFIVQEQAAKAGLSTHSFYPGFIESLVLIVVGYIGLWIVRLGKKLRVLPGELLLKQDTRAPVLYLRSFAADGSESPHRAPILSAFGGSGPVIEIPTDEEDMAKVLSEVGPFIAIGNPNEKLPEIGASRLYVGNENWQREVANLARNARLIILLAGTSDGLLWEIENVIKNCPPEKVVFYLSFDLKPLKGKSTANQKPGPYDEFRRLANQRMPHPLPEQISGSRFIMFREGWVPVRVEAMSESQQRSRQGITGSKANIMRRELAPVFESIGFESYQVADGFSFLRVLLGVLISIPIIIIAVWIAMVVGRH